MHDMFLILAGLAGILTALVHGILGETHVFARATIEPPRLRRLIRLVWQFGTASWIGLAVLLAAAPWIVPGPARSWIVLTAVAVFALGAVLNFIALNGRHPGWIALAAVCGLALAGL
jgi:putative flippase GtrA